MTTAQSFIPTNLGRATIGQIRSMSLIGAGIGFMSEYDGVINPYSGCSFGCDYCYASNFAKTDQKQKTWGEWVDVKNNAADLVRALAPGYMNDRVYYVSTVTDPYQPIERKVGTTRAILEALAQNQPRVKLVIQTRSPLVTRDLDLFHQIMDQGGRVQVNMTVTTDDEEVRKLYEPGCPSIPARLRAIASVQESGVQACITMTPLLPLGSARDFAQTLRDTGVTRFIVQAFQLGNAGRGKMIAQTDSRAIASTARHFDLTEQEAVARYHREYRENLAVLKEMLPGIGQGKPGFAPPF